MKLIDLLVQKLPKCGGWPEEAIEFHRHGPTELDAYFYGRGGGQIGESLAVPISTRYCGNGNGETVSREQYEAALAASKQAEWDGVGLPPVGCECEAMMSGLPGEQWKWRRVKVALSGIPGAEKECLVYDIETTRPAWVDEFRPIRTEAERKREMVLRSLMVAISGFMTTEDCVLAKNIYDAIAAGNIPGVKLDDI